MSNESENKKARRADDKRADSAVDWSDAPRINALGIAEEWSVVVEAEGQRVLRISEESVSGLDGDKFDQFKATVRNCAMHLLGFIGASPLPAAPASGSVAVDLDKLEALARTGCVDVENLDVRLDPRDLLELIALARSNSPEASGDEQAALLALLARIDAAAEAICYEQFGSESGDQIMDRDAAIKEIIELRHGFAIASDPDGDNLPVHREVCAASSGSVAALEGLDNGATDD